MSKKPSRLTRWLNPALSAALYLLLFVIFYLVLAPFNVGLQNTSRTAITTLFTFAISTLLFTHVYGSFRVDLGRKRTLFANMVCTVFFTDLITLLELQIMNTNPQNPDANARFVLFDRNLPLTLLAFLLQVLAIFLLIQLGFALYRRENPPRRSLIIAATQEGAEHTASKLHAMGQDFSVTEAIRYDCPDWRETVLENEAVFLTDLPRERATVMETFCYEQGIPVYLQAEPYDVMTAAGEHTVLVDTLYLQCGHREPSLWQAGIKRLFDVAFSSFLLLVLLPLLGVITLALALSGNGSPFFTQERKTKDGRIFRIIKFRTMYKDTNPQYSMRKGDDRITPLGRFLRKYRFDELPQLINIIHGDMSIVGPRPEMLSNVEEYVKIAPEFRYREQMRAGITGLAQLEGCYDTSPKDKAILDLMYIENFSIGLDLKLILRTFTVFFRHDAEGFSEHADYAPPLREASRNHTKNQTNGGKENG